MSFVSYCGYCGGEPLTVGHNHRADCPTLRTNVNNPPLLTDTRLVVSVVPFDARVAIAKLRRKLRCLLLDYAGLGVLEPDSIASANSLLAETETLELGGGGV